MSWQHERVYFDSDAYFDELIAAIDAARSSIRIAVYIFDADTWGRRLVDALCAAAGRGVHCQLLLDGFGSPDFEGVFGNQCDLARVEWRYYHPLPWQKFPPLKTQVAWWRRFLDSFGKYNRRNHAKYFLMDEEVAFSGSLNVSAKHSECLTGPGCWRDIAIQVRGEGVRELVEGFDAIWAHDRIRRTFNHPHVLLNYTRRLRRQLNFTQLRELRRAKRRVIMITPYFVPPRPMLRSLMGAARRGVDVRLISTRKTDVPITRLLARSYYRRLLKRGARIFEFQPGVLHAKAFLVDRHYYIGSMNFNHRSFFSDLEIAFRVQAPEAQQCLEQGIEQYLSQSREVTLAELDQASIWERLASRIVYFFRYLS